MKQYLSWIMKNKNSAPTEGYMYLAHLYIGSNKTESFINIIEVAQECDSTTAADSAFSVLADRSHLLFFQFFEMPRSQGI